MTCSKIREAVRKMDQKIHKHFVTTTYTLGKIIQTSYCLILRILVF